MARAFLIALLIATPVFGAGDVLPPTLDQSLAAARADVARATADEQRLTAEASRAGSEAQRLATEQRAAAAAIESAEARIDAAGAELAIARAAVAAQRQRLTERQSPVAGLLAGLIAMGRRPPLLALSDGSAEEFVRVRALLDTIMPAIRARTAALSGELAAASRAEAAATAARDRIAIEREGLKQQHSRFAALEQRFLSRQTQLAGQALGAGDSSLAGGETLAVLGDAAIHQRSSQAIARELGLLVSLPARPNAIAESPASPPFPYQLPAKAPVTAGLGSVDANGIRSRGIALATRRDSSISVPADGTIVFAGPFQRADSIVIIDHGKGWLSLISNAATTLGKGTTVHRGDSLGRATGPIEVELSHDGANLSPAFIAASSTILSNGSKGG